VREGPRSFRCWTTVAIILCAFLVLQMVSHGEAVVLRHPLHDLPYTVGSWTGAEQPLPPEIVTAAGVTDYTNRAYSSPQQEPVLLYVGYYSSQRSGDTIHSPKNCLPGSGWEPIRVGYAQIPTASGRQIVVNEYVVQQDQKKLFVFYWYQGRGRVVASEYASKFWTIADAVSRNRTDGALIRLLTPTDDGEDKARARLITFTQSLFPRLDSVIPN
jgi:EpsI family protein